MRPDGVVVVAPLFDQHLGLLQRVEDLAVRQLVAEFAVSPCTGTGPRCNAASVAGQRAAHHPVDAEAVGAHAEIGAPELLAERHRHGAAIGELGAERVALLAGLRRDGDREVVAHCRRRGELRGAVAPHKAARSDWQRHVHNPPLLIVRYRRHVGGCFPERPDRIELAAEDGAVELECFATVCRQR